MRRSSSNASSRASPATGRCAARAYAAQNRQMLSHLHQGEYYAWQGNLKGAIDQLEIASKAKDGDFYQASVVDTRLRALKREFAEQDKQASALGG
jgi:predicted Zn-dependent protease